MDQIAIIAFAQRFIRERYRDAMNGPAPCPTRGMIDRLLHVRDHLLLIVA